MTTAQETLSKHGIRLESTSPGRYYTTCPKCSHTRSREHQKNKVLGVTIGDDGSVRWGCNHCNWSGPEKGSGKGGNGARQDLPVHLYRDRDGEIRFRKVRNLPGREPKCWFQHLDDKGRWIKGSGGADTKILYRLDEVAKAIAAGRLVACAEGEKDCDTLWALGIAATCNAHGASEPGKRPKWTKEHSEQLAGADLVVFNDNDPAGYAHAAATCRLSLGLAKRVRRLDLKPHWTGGEMPKGADISDWLARGHTREDLDALIAGAPDYEPAAPAAPEEATPGNGGSGVPAEAGIDDAAEIEKLARMRAIEYDRERKAAGKRLGLSRLSLLDTLVKAKRSELGLDKSDGKAGHAIEFATPEPWPEPVAARSCSMRSARHRRIRHHRAALLRRGRAVDRLIPICSTISR